MITVSILEINNGQHLLEPFFSTTVHVQVCSKFQGSREKSKLGCYSTSAQMQFVCLFFFPYLTIEGSLKAPWKTSSFSFSQILKNIFQEGSFHPGPPAGRSNFTPGEGLFSFHLYTQRRSFFTFGLEPRAQRVRDPPPEHGRIILSGEVHGSLQLIQVPLVDFVLLTSHVRNKARGVQTTRRSDKRSSCGEFMTRAQTLRQTRLVRAVETTMSTSPDRDVGKLRRPEMFV